MMSNRRRTIIAILSIISAALFIRLLFGVGYYLRHGSADFIDDLDYISYAENIMSQGIFVPDISTLYSDSHVVGPAFPLIVAGLYTIFGKHNIAVIATNAFISALLCIVIFLLADSYFNRLVAMLASMWSIIYVHYIWYIPRVLKEIWLAFLFPLVIYLFIREADRKSISAHLLFLACAYTFLIHMDERFSIFAPFLIVAFLYVGGGSAILGLKKALIFTVVVLLLMVPWTIRNYQVYGKLVILTKRTTIFTDRIFGMTSSDDEYVQALKKMRSITLSREQLESVASGDTISELQVWQSKGLQKAIRLGFIPHRFNRSERLKAEFIEFWRPCRYRSGFIGDGYRFETPWSTRHNIALIITYGALLPFFIIGALRLIWTKHRIGIFFLVLVAIHAASHILFAHVQNRYRVPIDAFIIIIAFYGIIYLWDSFLKKLGKSPGAPKPVSK
jgi:4-amino-4-deoxy-L-arabinose transferase-like glycosyltransferase